MRIYCDHCDYPVVITHSRKLVNGVVEKTCICGNCDSKDHYEIKRVKTIRKPKWNRTEDDTLFSFALRKKLEKGSGVEAFLALVDEMPPDDIKRIQAIMAANNK